jgi:hypothetical protein
MKASDRLLDVLLMAAEQKVAEMQSGLKVIVGAAGGDHAHDQGRSEAPIASARAAGRGLSARESLPTPTEPRACNVEDRGREEKQMIIAKMRTFLDDLQRRVGAFKDAQGKGPASPE